MENPEKPLPESSPEVLPRMKTESSIIDCVPQTDPNQNQEKNFSKYQGNETVLNHDPPAALERPRLCKARVKCPSDPDSKYLISSLILRFVILIKAALYIAILYKVPVLSILLILELFGICSLTSLRKKMMLIYVVIIGVFFVSKLIGILDYAKNNSNDDGFEFVLAVLILTEVIEGFQIVPQIAITACIYKLHESRVFEIYQKNIRLCCFCCKKSK